MNLQNTLRTLVITLLAALPISSKATVFFSDTFGSGSTINSGSPADPTSTSAAYQMLSTKSQTPTPAVTSGDLVFGIPSTGSGVMEIQALFATNPIALVLPGDNIQLTIVFTNTSGILPASPGSSQIGVGLFNSGNIAPFMPLPGGTNVSTGLTLTDYTEKWQGYVGQIVSGSSKILTRPSMVGAANGWNLELVLSGSSSSTARNQSTVGPTTTTAVSLTPGGTYTEVLSIIKTDVSTLAITNTLYSGPDTNGSVVVVSGGVASGADFLTGGFNGLGFGYQAKVSGLANTIDVASIEVSGSVTKISGPPTIDTQPVNTSVATNGSCYFEVAATGFTMTYQWYRNGTALSDGGNISGANSSMLIIDNASTADQFSGANGYYCKITGAGNYSTNSTTNSLTLVTKKNLVWNGAGANWDFTSLNWNNGVTPSTFNFGDSVTFNDTGSANANVALNDNFLSASTWTISGSTAYAFSGPGYMGGAGSLVFNSSAAAIQLLAANSFTGGTIISNANSSLIVYCSYFGSLGSGPLTLAKPGILEIAENGGSSKGIGGDVTVNDDFTIQFDGYGSYAGVFLGNISGMSGKTLSLVPQNTSNTNRYRVYGSSTVCDANIAINPSGNYSEQAQYDGTVLAPYGNGTQTYNGVISGFGGIIQRGGTTILNGANTYSGGTTPTTASIGLGNNSALGTGPLNLAPEQPSLTGSGTIFASGGARTIANTVQYPSGTNNQTLIIGGTNDITFTSAINLAGADGQGNPGGRTLQIDNTGATTLSGALSDNSGNNLGLNKTGSGTLYLNSANTFPGTTTNNAGVLAGSGSLTGSVVVKTNASIGGGSSSAMGTLSVGGSLSIENGGGGFFRVNRSGSSSDKVSVTGSLSSSGTGTITVTNLGATLQVGDTFTLFANNKQLTGGNTLKIAGGVPAGLGWTNKLADNGTIQVVQSYATYPTNISYSVSGSTLTISWPATHQGWFLQAQTNNLSKGLGTNWVTVPGSDSVITTNLTIIPGNPTVFYRLKMP